jgi:tryptophan synthase alpha chain
VNRIRKVTDTPVAVGLGVSTPEQAKEVAKFADGVIVGSAFIKLILQTKDLSKSIGAVGQLAKDLARSMHRN